MDDQKKNPQNNQNNEQAGDFEGSKGGSRGDTDESMSKGDDYLIDKEENE